MMEIKTPELNGFSDIEKAQKQKRLNIIESREVYPIACERAKEKGLIDKELTLSDFRILIQRQRDRYSKAIGKAEYNELIGKEIFPLYTTFGLKEPSYFESLGSAEILKLGQITDPQFLMLGVDNQHSIREFAEFSHKINPSAGCNILDINKELIPEFKHLQGENKVQFAISDVRIMPYAENSMDLICTNSLFNELINTEKGEVLEKANLENINIIFQEVYRKLKSGSAFVVAEEIPSPFFEKGVLAHSEMRKRLLEAAEKAGFEKKNIFDSSYIRYILREDFKGTNIDDDGNANYGDKPLEIFEKGIVMKFVK